MIFKNRSLGEIAKLLKDADDILLFPHVQMDGDAIGSCTALCRALRKHGKKAFVVVEETVPAYLTFLMGDYCLNMEEAAREIAVPGACIAVDCSGDDRFCDRKELFYRGKMKLCLDHHITADGFGDFYYIEPAAAATGEIIYRLLRELGTEMDSGIAEALYAAIATDTGNFRYSNTTRATHEIIAALFDTGMNHAEVCRNLYENMRYERLRLHGAALEKVELFYCGRCAVTQVSQAMLSEAGATLDETEGIIDSVRSIEGVEIAILLKEHAENEIKVSFRAKTTADVSLLAGKFQGGGHVKAAGCTIHNSIEEAYRMVVAAAEEVLAGACI